RTSKAVSGPGLVGVSELERQVHETAARSAELTLHGDALDFPTTEKWPTPIAFNVVTMNYEVVEDGYTEEEVKLREESRKILELPDLLVSGTCVRVPVYTGHSLSINAECDRPLTAEAAREILLGAPGVVVTDVPNPVEATGRY